MKEFFKNSKPRIRVHMINKGRDVVCTKGYLRTFLDIDLPLFREILFVSKISYKILINQISPQIKNIVTWEGFLFIEGTEN